MPRAPRRLRTWTAVFAGLGDTIGSMASEDPWALAQEARGRAAQLYNGKASEADGARLLIRCAIALEAGAGGRPAARLIDFAERFSAAFDELERRSGGHNYQTLHAMRQALPAVPRDDFDRGLHALRRARIFTLDPSDGRHVRMKPEERDAGIQEGGLLLVYVARRADALDRAAVDGMHGPATTLTKAEKLQELLARVQRNARGG